jgi:hypothetical protein
MVLCFNLLGFIHTLLFLEMESIAFRFLFLFFICLFVEGTNGHACLLWLLFVFAVAVSVDEFSAASGEQRTGSRG